MRCTRCGKQLRHTELLVCAECAANGAAPNAFLDGLQDHYNRAFEQAASDYFATGFMSNSAPKGSTWNVGWDPAGGPDRSVWSDIKRAAEELSGRGREQQRADRDLYEKVRAATERAVRDYAKKQQTRYQEEGEAAEHFKRSAFAHGKPHVVLICPRDSRPLEIDGGTVDPRVAFLTVRCSCGYAAAIDRKTFLVTKKESAAGIPSPNKLTTPAPSAIEAERARRRRDHFTKVRRI